jgi:rubrerythrin
MTEEEKVINSKLANAYWYFIVSYKGTELFKNVYYKDAIRIDLSMTDELIITYKDRIEKIPMYYSKVKIKMLEFLLNYIKRIEWV